MRRRFQRFIIGQVEAHIGAVRQRERADRQPLGATTDVPRQQRRAVPFSQRQGVLRSNLGEARPRCGGDGGRLRAPRVRSAAEPLRPVPRVKRLLDDGPARRLGGRAGRAHARPEEVEKADQQQQQNDNHKAAEAAPPSARARRGACARLIRTRARLVGFRFRRAVGGFFRRRVGFCAHRAAVRPPCRVGFCARRVCGEPPRRVCGGSSGFCARRAGGEPFGAGEILRPRAFGWADGKRRRADVDDLERRQRLRLVAPHERDRRRGDVQLEGVRRQRAVRENDVAVVAGTDRHAQPLDERDFRAPHRPFDYL